MSKLQDQLKSTLPDSNVEPQDQDLHNFSTLVPKALSKIVQERAKDLVLVSSTTGYIAEWAKQGKIC